MEHVDDGVCRRRLQQPQQHRKSYRFIRHAILLLLITLSTVVLTSSYVSANHYYNDVTNTPGTVHGSKESGQQRLVSITPDGDESNVPVQIFLRLEDFIRVPCGMARKSNVQLVNTHETQAIRILSVEVLPEGEIPAFGNPNSSLETLVDRAISGLNRPRGPERSIFVSSFTDTTLQPGEACTVDIEFVPRCYGRTVNIGSNNSVDLQYRNAILLTLIIPSTGKTTEKTVVSTGEVVYDGRAVSFQIGGSAVENPLKLPEYILMKPRPKSQNLGYEMHNSNEGYVEFLGKYGETPLDIGAFSKSGGNYNYVNLTSDIASNQIYDNFFEATIRLKKVKDRPDIFVPVFFWKWKDPFCKRIKALSEFLLRREIALTLIELKEKLENGIVRWGDLRLQLKSGEIFIIEIRLDFKEIYQTLDAKALMMEGENARINDITLLRDLFHATKSIDSGESEYKNDQATPLSVPKRVVEPSDSGLFTVVTSTRSPMNNSLRSDYFYKNHTSKEEHLTKMTSVVDFGTLWAPYGDGNSASEVNGVVSSDVLLIGIRNRESIAVKVLRIEQTEYSFKSLESPLKKVSPHLLRGENKYLKIRTPKSLSTVVISPKETVTTLVELSHILPPQSAVLTGKIRITTNHFKKEFEFLDVFYKVRILRGYLDFDFESFNNDTSSTGSNIEDKSEPATKHLTKEGRSKSEPLIWWSIHVSSSTLEWAHHATKRHPLSLPAYSQKPLLKRLRFYNTFSVPLQLKSIELSDSCSGVARLWLLPNHPLSNGTRCLVGGTSQALESNQICAIAPPTDWGIISGFGGTWLDFAEVELFGEFNVQAENNNFNATSNISASTGIPFMCHLLLSNNLTSYALPIVLYDLSVHYSPRIRWDSSTYQKSHFNDVISQTGTRVANVFHGTINQSISVSRNCTTAILSEEEEYTKIIKLGWELLDKLNHLQQPCANREESPADKNRLKHFTRLGQLLSDSRNEGISKGGRSACDSFEHLNVDIGSLPADGSFHTASFYITNLNPLPIEIEARGSFEGMKLQMGSKTSNIIDFLPKKKHSFDNVLSEGVLDASKDDRLHSISLENGSDLNFDFITSTKTSILAKLRRQHDITLSPMLRPSNLEGMTGHKKMSSLEKANIRQVWEALYERRHVITLFRSVQSNPAQDLRLPEYLISWDEFCRQNFGCQARVNEYDRGNGNHGLFNNSVYGCLLSEDKQIFVLNPSKCSSGNEKKKSIDEIRLETKTSWRIPPGAVARIELIIIAPRHSLVNRDVSRFSVFGLSLFNKATQHEMPIVVNYHAIRGHLFLRALNSNSIKGNIESRQIHVPCFLFSHPSRIYDSVTSPVHQNTQYQSSLSPPLEVVSTFSNPVRFISARSTCTSLFQFENLFHKDIQPDGSGVSIGHVTIHLPCNSAKVEGPSSFNYYSCAHSWLQLRYSAISCNSSDNFYAESNVAASETDAVSHALRLSEDLMLLMNDRFGNFYGKLEGLLGKSSPLDHTLDNSSALGKPNVTNDGPVFNEKVVISHDTYSRVWASPSETQSVYIGQGIPVVSKPLSSFPEQETVNLSNSPSSLPAFLPSVRVDAATRAQSTLLDLLLKITAFYESWHQGVELFNWDVIEDEVEMKVSVLQEENQESSVWKEILVRAASSSLNITAGTELSTAKLQSSISLPKVSTKTSLRFFYSSPYDKTDVKTDVTPVSFVSDGYLVVRNPTAAPIKVRFAIVESDARINISSLQQEQTKFSAVDYGGELLRKRPSTTYAQSLSSIMKLGTSEALDTNILDDSFSASSTTYASTSSWWNGGSYFLYSLNGNSLLQANHNITIRSAGGTYVSLINPSMQAVNALSMGCGQRCGLRHEVMTLERSEAPLGAISSSNLDWIKKGSVLSNSNPSVFALPLSAQVEKVIPPLATVKLGPILFRPSARGQFSGCLVLENSLSGAEFIDLLGIGGVEELRMESWRIEDDSVSYEQYVPPFRSTVSLEFRSRKNPYTVGVSNIENRYNHPTLVFSGSSNPHTHSPSVKSVHVTNSGDLPISIERVYLGSSEIVYHTKLRPHPEDFAWFSSHAKDGCEYSGFRILGCITNAEEQSRAEKFDKGFFAPVRRWFIGKDKANMFDALPENSSNTAQGFNLLPGESTQIHIAHVADCSFQKIYATLHLQYRGRSSVSPNHEAKPWRQGFQSHEEKLLVGYEMTSNEFNECQIAKPRAQGLIFSKSGRDPIGMHVRGEYPIAYYAIDSLFNWMARRYSAGSSNVPADYAYLFVYTASMFVEHSTVALLVSIAFLLFFHALIFLVDRTSQSKAFRDMWRDNISLRESTKVGWRNMLLLGRSDTHHVNVEALVHVARDVVKSGTINALKPTTTLAGGVPLACITPGGGFAARACPNASALTINHGKDATCNAMDHRSNPSRAKQQTLSDAIFWQLERNAYLGFLPAGLGWRQAASAAPDVFYNSLDSSKQEANSGRVSKLLRKRETEAGSSKFDERDVEIEISCNNDDAHSVLELEYEDEFDVASHQEGSGSELDESTADSDEDEDDDGINVDLTQERFQALKGLDSINTIELKRISSSSPSWYVHGNPKKSQSSNVEIIANGDRTKGTQNEIAIESRVSSMNETDDVDTRRARVKQPSVSLSPTKDRGRHGELNNGKGNGEGAVIKRRVVTRYVFNSHEISALFYIIKRFFLII